LWLAETSQQPISQTTWLKVTPPHCNHCNHCYIGEINGQRSCKNKELWHAHVSSSERSLLNMVINSNQRGKLCNKTFLSLHFRGVNSTNLYGRANSKGLPNRQICVNILISPSGQTIFI
jgi:hypothetical protein